MFWISFFAAAARRAGLDFTSRSASSALVNQWLQTLPFIDGPIFISILLGDRLGAYDDQLGV